VTSQQAYYLVADAGDVLDDIIPMTMNDTTPMEWPGYVGYSVDSGVTDGFTPHFLPMPNSMDAAGSPIDYTTYGEPGEVNRNAYSMLGPVEPNLVEDFQLYGNVAAGQRRPEYSQGSVGDYDHADYTMLQIAQQMEREAYPEEAIISLLNSGGY
jgi:hypothetical protein